MFSKLVTSFDDFIPHWHNPLSYVTSHIFIFVAEGKLRYYLNQKLLVAHKGEWVLIPPGTWREAMNDGPEPHQKYTVTFETKESLAGNEWGLSLLQRPEPTSSKTFSIEFLRERFVNLHRHRLEDQPYANVICSGILLEILGTVNRELEQQNYPLLKVRQVQKIEQYIQKFFRTRITLQTLADQIKRSPNYTLSIFKEVTGHTPSQYQHRLRITTAMEMLRSTPLTVAMIAEHLGYYDASSFYKMFRKQTGMSPTDYAGRQRGNELD